jgi:hypothetical protein
MHKTWHSRVGQCDIPGSRRMVKFKQLVVYPRTTGTQTGTHTHDRVKELAGKLLDWYRRYVNSQPGNNKLGEDLRNHKRPQTLLVRSI